MSEKYVQTVPYNNIVAAGFGWQDILGYVQPRPSGGTVPTFQQIDTGLAFFGLKFDVGDETWITYHLPHDYIPNTDIYIHAHWIANPNGSNRTQPVKWEFSWAYASGYDVAQFNLTTPTIVTATTTPVATAYRHYISEVSLGAGSGVGMEVDGLIFMRVRRVTNGGTDNGGGIYLLLADCHYRSHGLPTKNRNPDFYT